MSRLFLGQPAQNYMIKKNLPISIFFPAYNEEDNIAETVRQAEEVVQRITDTYEIIVVNDGSKDDTGPIADQIALVNSRVRVIHHSPNQGYGGALWSGFQAAKYDWVFFTDADLQFRLDELVNLAEHIPENDVVLGYRAPRKDPFMRLVNAWGWNLLNRFLFGLKVRDIDCAFKLMRRDLVASLPVKSRGAMISAEILIRLQRKGIVFKEVPVTHLPRLHGEATGAKPAVIIRAFKELFGLYRGALGQEGGTAVQMGKFAVVGVMNTVLDLSTYIALTRYVDIFSEHLVWAKMISFILGTICSFVLNRTFTFAVKRPITVQELTRFYSTIGMGIVINVGALYVLHNMFNIHDLVAVGVATVLTFFWGFAFSKFWVFTRQSQKPAHAS